MSRIITTAGACAALLVALALPATAHEFRAGPLLVKHPWMRATPAGAAVAGGYLTIVNTGPDDRLLGGTLDGAKGFGLHETATTDGMTAMRPTGPVAIPAGGTLTLAPGGRHIMFTGLAGGYAKGAMVPGTLVFEHAGTVKVEFAVDAMGARTPGDHGMADMPGH